MFELLGIVVVVVAAVIALGRLSAWLIPQRVDYDCRLADGYIAEDATQWSEAYFQEWRTVQKAFRWEPYSYWRSKAFAGRFINVGENGIRVTWNPPLTKGAPCRRIYLFGGSTMWGAGVRDWGTIPSFLSQLLERERFAAHVTNLGQVGYVSTQEVITLLRLLQAGNRPDFVIFYDGYNDVLSAAVNGCAGLSYRESNRCCQFNLRKNRWALSAAAIGSLFPTRAQTKRARPRRGFAPVSDPLTLAQQIATVEAANVNLVQSLGREFGFAVRFFWQPTIFDKKTLTDYERTQRDCLAPMEELFAHTSRELRSFTERANGPVVFLDGVFALARCPYFLDWAHITEGGNEIIARRMLAEITPELARITSQEPIV